MKLTLFPSFLLLTIFFAIGCEDESPVVCSQMEEEEVIALLSDQLDNCTCEISIIRANFLGNTVYALLGTAPNCTFAFDPTLYNCEGNVIPGSLHLSQERYTRLVKFEEVLLRCND